MAEYKSNYTGEQIDAGIAKAYTAISNVQNVDEGGTNGTIKISKGTSGGGTTVTYVKPKGLDNAAFKDVDTEIAENSTSTNLPTSQAVANYVSTHSGGGGTSNFNVKVVDATNPDDWSQDNDGPSQAVLEDIVENHYQAIRIINGPMDENGSTYELDMLLTGLIDSDENEYWAREYQKFDSGDEEEQTPAFMQVFSFEKQGSDDAEMRVSQYELGGGSSGGGNVYFATYEIGGTYNDEVSLDLTSITNAIDDGSEVIVRVNGTYGYDTRYFRIETTSLNGKTTIDGNDYWTPIFKCKTSESEYTMVYDRYESEAFIFKMYDSYPKFIPTSIDLPNNAITFDLSDYSYMFNQKPKNITLNLGDSGADLWIDFKLAIKDETSGEEAYSYISEIIPDHSSGSEMTVFTLRVYNDGGNVSTKIYIDSLTTSVPA